MKKRRVAVFTGGRFEYGILRPVIRAIADSKKLELLLVVSGIHSLKKYGSTVDIIRKDGFQISAEANFTLTEHIYRKARLEIRQGRIEVTKVFKKIKLQAKNDLF